MKLPRYAEYRDSGVDWLGEVPAHWDVKRLKTAARVRMSNVDKKSVDGQDFVRLCNYVNVYYNERITADIEFMEATATLDQIDAFALRRGDVLITKDSETPDDIAVPALVVDDLDGVLCGYHLAHIRPDPQQLDGAFLAWAMRASCIAARFHSAATGVTRFGLSRSDITDVSVMLPPLDEQRAIAAFLGRETARIDALIATKRRFLALLAEKRAALISRAVTRGLDPDVPLKDSGVQWFARIPAHWSIRPLRRVVTRIEQGWSPECESRLADIDEWAVMKAGCVNTGQFREEDHKTLPADIDPDTSLEIRSGDLLMSRACGTSSLVGSVGYVRTCRPRLLLCDKLFRLIAKQAVCNPEYLALALSSRQSRFQIEREISGAGGLANNITKEAVRALLVALPPLREQEQIVKSVNAQAERMDSLSQQTLDVIGKLSEYRTSLVAKAVSGSIDTRIAA